MERLQEEIEDRESRLRREEIGRQVWEHLLEVEELYQELEAMDASARDYRSMMESRGYDGSWWPLSVQVTALYRNDGWGSFVDDLRQLVDQSREDAPLTAHEAE